MRGYRPPLPIRERLEGKTRYDGDCWRWTGSHWADGYGVIKVGSRIDGTRRNRGVHVVSFEEFHGEVPAGCEVDHTCFVRDCWNPMHLRAIPAEENRRIRGEVGKANLRANLVKARAVRWSA